MYFKKEDIQEVSKHVFGRADSLHLVIGAKDSAQFNKMIDNILAEKTYYEGEEIAPHHMDAIKGNVKTVINNISAYLVRADEQFKKLENMQNPVDYFSTAVDALYITAMQRLGCPDMPIIHLDEDIKMTLEEAALKVSGGLASFDISKEDAFDRQRGKDATEISKGFGLIAEEIKNGKKAEAVGKMIAEYQAFKEHRKSQNAFWRFLHRTENKERNALVENMGKLIRGQLPKGMKDIDLDEAVPNSVSRKVADALIKGEVEGAGPDRLDNKLILKLYGRAPFDQRVSDQRKIINEASHKISLGRDEQFLNDVMGTDITRTNRAPKEKVFTNPSLVKD